MATLADLHNVLAALCPINGIETTSATPASQHEPAPIDWSTIAQWKIDFDSSASDAQKVAAQAALLAFDSTAVFSVSMRQGRLALIAANLYTQVQATVANDPVLQVWWDFSQTLDRNESHLLQVANGLNLTSSQIDALFKAASTL